MGIKFLLCMYTGRPAGAKASATNFKWILLFTLHSRPGLRPGTVQLWDHPGASWLYPKPAPDWNLCNPPILPTSNAPPMSLLCFFNKRMELKHWREWWTSSQMSLFMMIHTLDPSSWYSRFWAKSQQHSKGQRNIPNLPMSLLCLLKYICLVSWNIFSMSPSFQLSARAASGIACPALTPSSTNVSNACHIPQPNVSTFFYPNT